MKQNVTYKHYFDRWEFGEPGGFTMCVDWERGVIGVSICSEKDQYCKKTGRRAAKDRADEQYCDGSIIVVSLPVALSGRAFRLQRRAAYEVFKFINRHFPNKQFGFTFETFGE